MVYRIKKLEKGFSATDNQGEERTFDNEAELLYFLAGWAIEDMKVGEEKLVTDVEIANAMV